MTCCLSAVRTVGSCASASFTNTSSTSTFAVTVSQCDAAIGSISVDGRPCQISGSPTATSASCTVVAAVASWSQILINSTSGNGCGACVGPNACGTDERVESHSCIACALGMHSAAGADPSGPDTQCDTRQCPEDFFVLNHTCTHCPAGRTRPLVMGLRNRAISNAGHNIDTNLEHLEDTSCWPPRCDTSCIGCDITCTNPTAACMSDVLGSSSAGVKHLCAALPTQASAASPGTYKTHDCCWGTCSDLTGRCS
eukprot:COSAG01_NODE_8559_length_2742_cov_4.254257_3_plen_254_part_00